MFCHKCGNKLPEDAVFCNKCGVKTVISDTEQQTPAEAATPRMSDAQNNGPEPKKSKKLPIILAVIAGFIILIAIAISQGDGSGNTSTTSANAAGDPTDNKTVTPAESNTGSANEKTGSANENSSSANENTGSANETEQYPLTETEADAIIEIWLNKHPFQFNVIIDGGSEWTIDGKKYYVYDLYMDNPDSDFTHRITSVCVHTQTGNLFAYDLVNEVIEASLDNWYNTNYRNQNNSSANAQPDEVIMYDFDQSIKALLNGAEIPDFLAFASNGSQRSNQGDSEAFYWGGAVNFEYSGWGNDVIQNYTSILQDMGFVLSDSGRFDNFGYSYQFFTKNNGDISIQIDMNDDNTMDIIIRVNY